MTLAHPAHVQLERRIAARPETVFSFFTNPDRFIRWQGVEAELDPRPGGVFRVRVTGKSGMVASGAFVEVEPPHRLVFTWGWEPVDGHHPGLTEVGPGTSTVEIVLIADGEGTILRLRHTGLPTDDAGSFHRDGWGMMLDRLALVATGGEPGPYELAEL
jgi:uncharacterized protein YndB with AHSA1/START domain